jgi:LPS-assembly lipoprotein
MRAKRSVITGLVFLVSAMLTGCGFTPMYGSAGLANGLQDISVVTGPERVDFLLQEALYDRLGSRGASGRYTLQTTTEINKLGLGVGADAIAARFAVELEVQYELHMAGNADALVTGRISSEASYDVSSSVYASLAAERDAEERAAQMVANRLVIQLARALQDQDGW